MTDRQAVCRLTVDKVTSVAMVVPHGASRWRFA